MNVTLKRNLFRLGLIAALLTPFAAAQTLTLTPNALTFDVTVGAGDPPDQVFRIESSTPGQSFTARVRTGLTNPRFLTLFPTNGQTPANVTVSVDSSGFTSGGVVNATIDVTNNSTGQTGSVQVTIRVFPSTVPPQAGVTPAQLSFNAASSSSNVPSKQLTIQNSGGGVLSYDLAITYPSGPQGWLAATPLTGALGTTNTRLHQVAATPASLDNGTYTAQIILTGNGSNTPLVIPVTLTVGGPPAPPTLTVSPSSLLFTVPEGSAPPPARLIEVRNTGTGTAEYQLRVSEEGSPWLSVDPPAGAVSGGPFVHTVSVDTTTLLPGSFTANLILTSEALETPLLIPVSLQIPTPGIIFTQPATLDFVGRQGMPLRERRSVGILNEPLGPGRWSATVTSPNSSWLKVSPSEGELPGRIIVEIDTTGIGASTLDATIGIAATRGSQAALRGEGGPVGQEVVTANLPVRLTLLSDGPRLSATPTALRLQAAAAGDPASQLLLVDNVGGPELIWSSTLETDSGGNWLSLSPASGTAPTETLVRANPAGQQPGAYQGRIRLGAGDQSFIVPVVMVVSDDGPIIETDFSSAYWETAEGRPATAPADFQVLNRGAGQPTWSTETAGFTGADAWASGAPSSGSTAPGAPGGFSLTARTQGLQPGLYGALTSVDSGDAGARRWVSSMLQVRPQGALVPTTLKPAGMLLESGGAGATTQQLEVWRNREGQAEYLAGASTFDGGQWLSVSPAEGTTGALGAATLDVSADPAGLSPGVYRGLVGVSFGDGVVDSTFVTLAVKPTGACTADSIYLAPLSPRFGFVGRVGRAVRLEAAVIDNCGDPVENAAVLALFNSGDAGIPLKPLGGGRYSATWAPLAAQGQANVILRAQSGPGRDGVHIIGFLDGGAATVISRFGVVNAASFRGGEAIAPGEIISVFGRDLTDGAQHQAESIPLPRALGDTTLRIGPAAAPFYFAGQTQLNVQAPFELTPGTTTQLVARSGVSYSTPVEVAVGSARPGVFSLLPGDPERAIVQNQDNSINGPANPAARGEAIVAYVTGAGAVEPAVDTGAASPSAEPLARVAGAATATLGGAEAEILYFGMTPGFVGLAQINLIVPEFAPAGSNVPLVITVDGEPSNRLSVAIEAGP